MMKKVRTLILSAITLFSCLSLKGMTDSGSSSSISVDTFTDGSRLLVPIAGNTWESGPERSRGTITDSGIRHWSDVRDSFTTYVRVAATGTLHLWMRGSVPTGNSQLAVRVGDIEKIVGLRGTETKDYELGVWNVRDTGYLAIHVSGLAKTGDIFADMNALLLDGTAINDRTVFVKNNKGNFFYWGRRGSSTHLIYLLPSEVQAEWFYTEVTVPQGNDILGSYFMADGFGEGYFGMQVNSPTTRHILFSVWSPFKTDNPKDIPSDQRIQLLRRGDGVHAGKFGNEGSGGQSYLNYPWKAGRTYRFLLHASPHSPDSADYTVFTAYFYAPEARKWRLIASFRRPQTYTYLTHLHSFLENFLPEQGDKERRVLFGNQWIKTAQGQWIELNKMHFSTDNTGRIGYRMDYAGGVVGQQFYLQNCGFFSDYTPAGKLFERPLIGTPPRIDFQKLP